MDYNVLKKRINTEIQGRISRKFRSEEERQRDIRKIRTGRLYVGAAKSPAYRGLKDEDLQGDMRGNSSFYLARSDQERKNGNYVDSTNTLMNFEAGYLRPKKVTDPEFLQSKLKAIQSRARRIVKQAYESGRVQEAGRALLFEEYIEKRVQNMENAGKTPVSEKGLVGKLPIVIPAAVGLLGIFLLSGNITGNVIASNLSQTNLNIVGSVLFVLGIVGVMFFLRR